MKKVSLIMGGLMIASLFVREQIAMIDRKSIPLNLIAVEQYCIDTIGFFDAAVRDAKHQTEVKKHKAEYGW